MIAPIALVSLSVQAAPGAPARCEATRAAMPSALAGWRQSAAAPTIGKAFIVQAADPATIRGLRLGEVARPGGAALVPFEVGEDATYRIALSNRAWVDVAAGNALIKASAHGHGPACTGIAKMVDFPLKRGRYALHLTGISTPSVKVLIAKA
jgi:hypothetical protein